MTTEERFTLWLDNEYGIYHEVCEQVAGVIDEGYSIKTLSNWLDRTFFEMCGIEDAVPSFLGDFLSIPDFEELAAELVERERTERRVSA
jgi:hypothetical protein